MTTAQIVLGLELATMVFSVALDLRVADFLGVARAARAVVAALVPQFLLRPVATWALTLVLDLPPDTGAALILVAACPGGALSNVVTQLGRGNTALSVSISAVASLLPLGIIASLWGIWHVVSGLTLATICRRQDVRSRV